MSIPKKPFKLTRNLFRRIRKLYDGAVKALANWLLRGLRRIGKRPRWENAGFALPTTIMVLLVVVLLTTALVFRSFDRNRNAVFSRSEQVIQNTSTPALDRAKSKLTQLLSDPKLPRGTPPDLKLLEVMNDEIYTFGDETRLKIAFDYGDGKGDATPNNSIQATGDQYDETLNTAWKYPVDTDGDGYFDSFTLYGLYWRSPNPGTGSTAGKYARGRVPLEARSLPQESSGLDQCKTAAQSAATAVQQGDWVKLGANLSKAFYIYAATVPITDISSNFSPGPFSPNKFKRNTKGDKAFTGLEYEQDRYRSGLNNNAVWYEDDLIINPGGAFRLNGKVFTNSNLLLAGTPGTGKFQFFQVSSKYSCFYKDQENSKINIGGNVGTGDISQTSDQEPATVDLYRGYGNSPIPGYQPTINGSTRSTNSAGGYPIANNQAAYNRRINLMKATALSFCTNECYQNPPSLPAQFSDADTEPKKSIEDALENSGGADTPQNIVAQQVEIYLRNRTRRVPYAENNEPDGTGAEAPYTPDPVTGIDASVFSTGIEPPVDWREPLTGNNFINTSGTSVSLNTANLPQTNPDSLTNQQDPPEDLLGDRIIVGNNLPALVKNSSTGKYSSQVKPPISGTQWTAGGGDRYRMPQAQPLDNLGVTDRNGFWERAAAFNPNDAPSNNANGGGLRIITGAGIYVDGLQADGASFPRDATLPARGSFLPQPSWDTRFVDPTGADPNRIAPASLNFRPSQTPIIAWPDLMPMTGGIDPATNRPIPKKGDLLMRATVVYHYVDSAATKANPTQTPIACVSSYYDPTNSQTARNIQGLPDVSGGVNTTGDGTIEQLYDGTTPGSQTREANSNNGVVYSFPGASGYQRELLRQARLVFPNGRVVNQALRNALNKIPANRTLVDQSAIDSSVCALAILENRVGRSSAIPDGAIKEASFLDAREVKAIDKRTPADAKYDIKANYDLPLEQRQPLEIRVTDIDMGLLAAAQHGTAFYEGSGTQPEYLLPNSGIIYASRDDALSDNSNSELSSSDYRLDPTRRPNGIRIVNGLRLARGDENSYSVQEKGLILATNVPAYVKGNFNLHLVSKQTGLTFSGPELEEFNPSYTLQANWSNFYDRGDTSTNGGLERRFACRQNQPKCLGNGDQWRPATIIADAITLQSVNFKEGYRNQGDFDLRNNAGNAAYIEDDTSVTPPRQLTKTLAGSRMTNGFFDNSFVTSANWSNASGVPSSIANNNYQTSYLVNGVTPIQRRARVYAYQTEICRKIPVSQCTAEDWQSTIPPVVTTALNTSQPAAGTVQESLLRYPQRVAFKKVQDSNNQKLFKYYYDETDNGYPQPENTVGIRPNSLWFRTRNKPVAGVTPDASYAGQLNPTQYLDIFQPPELQNLDLGIIRGYLAASQNQQILMAFTDATTNNLKGATAFDAGSPPTFVPNRIRRIYQAATAPTAGTPLATQNRLVLAGPTSLDINALASSQKTELTGGGAMAVYSAGYLSLTSGRKLTLKGDAGSVFVIVVSGNLAVQQNALVLEGVVPENVYWIVTGQVNLSVGATLQGNVITQGQINFVRNSTLEGRALSLAAGGVSLRPGYNNRIVAPSGNQPRLVPVTQIQSPNGSPATGASVDPGDTSAYPQNWLQPAQSTNYNAAFVVGDSPPRPQELSSGLNNLVRLQENWGGKTVTIKGSFIQQKRSAFATGPFPTTRKATEPAPVIEGADGRLSIFGYPTNGYWTSNGSSNPATKPGQLPFFNTPTRQWGFDVGLLSQSPDLFSQRFTQDIPKTQNYYRQVGRDDDWIKTLLCAAEPANPSDPDQRVGKVTTPGGSVQYSNYAIRNPQERPNCPNFTKATLPLPNPPSATN